MGAMVQPGRSAACLVPVAALMLLELPASAMAQEYQVDLEAPRRVAFVSSTRLDEFEGITDRIDGFVLLDGGGVRPTGSVPGSRLYFEVDLASLKTGISLRDRHMRENYLHVDAHPYATFDAVVDRIEGAADGSFRVFATGGFAVHGVERERTLECQASAFGEGYRVTCAFPVRLEDHDIEIPRLMFMKLAPEVGLELAFRIHPVA